MIDTIDSTNINLSDVIKLNILVLVCSRDGATVDHWIDQKISIVCAIGSMATILNLSFGPSFTSVVDPSSTDHG